MKGSFFVAFSHFTNQYGVKIANPSCVFTPMRRVLPFAAQNPIQSKSAFSHFASARERRKRCMPQLFFPGADRADGALACDGGNIIKNLQKQP